MRFVSLIALFAIAVSTLACAGSAAEEPAAAGDPTTDDGAAEEIKAAVIGEESNGKSVDVPLGKSFTIALLDNAASSGYKWMVKSVDRTLGQPKITYVPSAHVACLGC